MWQLNVDINLSQTPGLQLVLCPWDSPQACKWGPSNKTTFTNDFTEETLIKIYFSNKLLYVYLKHSRCLKKENLTFTGKGAALGSQV